MACYFFYIILNISTHACKKPADFALEYSCAVPPTAGADCPAPISFRCRNRRFRWPADVPPGLSEPPSPPLCPRRNPGPPLPSPSSALPPPRGPSRAHAQHQGHGSGGGTSKRHLYRVRSDPPRRCDLSPRAVRRATSVTPGAWQAGRDHAPPRRGRRQVRTPYVRRQQQDDNDLACPSSLPSLVVGRTTRHTYPVRGVLRVRKEARYPRSAGRGRVGIVPTASVFTLMLRQMVANNVLLRY